MNNKTQKEWITIPVLCKQGYMLLKKIKVMWYPSLEAKNRTMIKFSDDI